MKILQKLKDFILSKTYKDIKPTNLLTTGQASPFITLKKTAAAKQLSLSPRNLKEILLSKLQLANPKKYPYGPAGWYNPQSKRITLVGRVLANADEKTTVAHEFMHKKWFEDLSPKQRRAFQQLVSTQNNPYWNERRKAWGDDYWNYYGDVIEQFPEYATNPFMQPSRQIKKFYSSIGANRTATDDDLAGLRQYFANERISRFVNRLLGVPSYEQ